jgi:hypothetical protein
MKISTQAFDKNLALFDASATLTFFRQMKSQTSPTSRLRITTDCLTDIEKVFPRLFTALRSNLSTSGFYSLYFWHLSDSEKDLWDNFLISGPAKVFFISSQPQCAYQPGDIVELGTGEDLTLTYGDMTYGFLGVWTPTT